MADPEAAARAPPPPVAVAPPAPPAPAPTPTPKTAAAVAKAALADAVVYCFLSALFVCCAASIALIVARYAFAVAGAYPSAYPAVARVVRDVFLLAFLAMEMLCPFTVLVLVLRLARRQPEPPEALLVIEGVHVTVQVHGLEHPGALGRRRQGSGYGLIPLLIFVLCSMGMLQVLLMQERWPAKRCCAQTAGDALLGDTACFICSVMVISIFIPHVLTQLRNMPR